MSGGGADDEPEEALNGVLLVFDVDGGDSVVVGGLFDFEERVFHLLP